MPFEKGYLLVPDGPGLGIAFNEEAFDGMDEYVPGKAAGFSREDGAYTNW
ncbi:hypothetical protein HN799_05390 [Candidatus Woesearchaeota archaeon]|nr:hypothetical protein [Candidatus Woesearchaeota archaeon]